MQIHMEIVIAFSEVKHGDCRRASKCHFGHSMPSGLGNKHLLNPWQRDLHMHGDQQLCNFMKCHDQHCHCSSVDGVDKTVLWKLFLIKRCGINAGPASTSLVDDCGHSQ